MRRLGMSTNATQRNATQRNAMQEERVVPVVMHTAAVVVSRKKLAETRDEISLYSTIKGGCSTSCCPEKPRGASPQLRGATDARACAGTPDPHLHSSIAAFI